MESTASLKRTRTGRIYSDVFSSLTKHGSHSLKRRKATNGNAQNLTSACYLEALPSELLQQIFLVSNNGNLISASPLIAAKLSGQSSVYHAAFLLAFFSHDVDNIFDIHQLHYLIPMLDVPLSSWGVRSMTRAVLNSRWCKWGLVKSWLARNLQYAATLLINSADPGRCRGPIEEFFQGHTDIVTLSGRCWSGEDGQNRQWQLETDIFDVRLSRNADIYNDIAEEQASEEEDMQDFFMADWDQELLFQAQMRIFGVVTIGEEKMQNIAPAFSDDDSLRYIVEEYIGLKNEDIKPQQLALDFWQLLDERAIRATRNSHWLRETLAIDYFFSPDDQPYKVSPRLYRAAAGADLRLDTIMSWKKGSYVPALYALFTIDPLSLPRTDPLLRAWAAEARDRLLDFQDRLIDLQDELQARMEEEDRDLRIKVRNRYRAVKLETKHRFEMDLTILQYIMTGSLASEFDSFAPSFAEPLPWLGERLNPSPEALAAAEKATFPSTDRWDIDIFDMIDDFSYRGVAFKQQLLQGPLKFLTQDGMWLDDDALNKAERNECVRALTTYDGYYRSWHHDDYDQLFPEEEWVTDTDEDEEEQSVGSTDLDIRVTASNIHYGEEPRENNMELTDNDMAIDWVVAGTNPEYPIPPLIKDTELPEPIFGPPKWFHAAEKPYLKQLS